LSKFKGYLDRLRENVEALDEAIETARAESKAKKGSDSRTRLQWAKTLRDLVELRNQTLINIKAHLLGRDETGAPIEPNNMYKEGYSQTMFERAFNGLLLSPWTRDKLEIQCEDCNEESEDVGCRHLYVKSSDGWTTETFWLCSKCYAKRETTQPTQEQMDKDEEKE